MWSINIFLTKHPETLYSLVKLLICTGHIVQLKIPISRALAVDYSVTKYPTKLYNNIIFFQTVECIENEKGHTINKQVIDCKTRKWKTTENAK